MGNERFYADIMAMHPEVTGSCNLVIVKLPDMNTIRFVVDCGLFQEKEYNELNNKLPFNPENIDFCLVTHNHVDHIGRLPLMVKKGFSRKIYATKDTCRLMPFALYDTQKILKKLAERKNTKYLYSDMDVHRTNKLLMPCEYEQTIEVNKNVKVTFFNNGHLIGSAIILVQISYPGYNDINLLFTGDYNNRNMFFDVKGLPDWVLKLPLTIIQESTYGDMLSSSVIPCFENNVLDCINQGGTVLIPVFSLGRSQEILYTLKNMQDRGDLNKQIPIFLDGKLAIKYTNLYINGDLGINKNMNDFIPSNITFITDESIRLNVLQDQNVKIVLTTSGMASYGPAQVYIPEYISRRNVLIQFTGYTAEGTLGAALKKAKIGEIVETKGLITKKIAEVKDTSEFSAHAKADEMIKFLQQFEKINLVLVNHGELETKKIFAERILSEVDTKLVGILGRDIFFRVNPYKLIKTLSTKFD